VDCRWTGVNSFVFISNILCLLARTIYLP